MSFVGNLQQEVAALTPWVVLLHGSLGHSKAP